MSYRTSYHCTPTLEEVEKVAHAAVKALASAGIRSCLVGGMACSIYGNSRVPSDVDIVCLTETHAQEELKRILVSNDSKFFTVRSKNPYATYRVLWYRLSYIRDCKVDVLTPGTMNIPLVPTRRIAYKKDRSDLPLMPFLPLLLLKLQAWQDHQNADKMYLREKQHVDVRDIDELLELAIEKYDVDFKRDGQWLLETFVNTAAARVRVYVRHFPTSAESWRSIGFRV
ncbi:helicase ATP-binding domain-containing protein [Favolaschia claudopus]|uniref:Helicase ATP-binding domain-containing protein n=1 Tax=Favolaschia claudopus TaxID=2862362 RepID=A0AAW0E833_9AGAR